MPTSSSPAAARTEATSLGRMFQLLDLGVLLSRRRVSEGLFTSVVMRRRLHLPEAERMCNVQTRAARGALCGSVCRALLPRRMRGTHTTLLCLRLSLMRANNAMQAVGMEAGWQAWRNAEG